MKSHKSKPLDTSSYMHASVMSMDVKPKRPSQKWTSEQQEKYEQTSINGHMSVTSLEVRQRSPSKIYQKSMTPDTNQ